MIIIVSIINMCKYIYIYTHYIHRCIRLQKLVSASRRGGRPRQRRDAPHEPAERPPPAGEYDNTNDNSDNNSLLHHSEIVLV